MLPHLLVDLLGPSYRLGSISGLASRANLPVLGLTIALLGCVTTASCVPSSQTPSGSGVSSDQLVELAVPSAAGAMAPNLASSARGPLLSWIEPTTGGGHRLRVSRWEVQQEKTGDRFGAPVTVVEGEDFFANWADFPSIAQRSDGSLEAHWLRTIADGTYAYGVALARSDDGDEWREEGWLHDDLSPSEHGFVSFAPTRNSMFAFWLDGREMEREGGAMALRARGLVDRSGPSHRGVPEDAKAKSHEVVLDDRVCECCQTGAAATLQGPIVVYRNRSVSEIRDIWRVRWIAPAGDHAEGRWSEPAPVHEDGWRIAGCPVNGPAVAADADRVAVAWFTAAGDRPQVRLAISADGGDTFGPMKVIDDEAPTGRVDVEIRGSRVWISWLGRSEHGASILLRELAIEGGSTLRQRGPPDQPPLAIADASTARSAGFPRMLLDHDRLWFAWVETGQPSRLRVSALLL